MALKGPDGSGLKPAALLLPFKAELTATQRALGHAQGRANVGWLA